MEKELEKLYESHRDLPTEALMCQLFMYQLDTLHEAGLECSVSVRLVAHSLFTALSLAHELMHEKWKAN